MKKLPLLSCLICLLIPGSAALSQPSSPFMLDTGIVPKPARGSQYSIGVASNGDGWRVAFWDLNDYSVRTSGVSSDGALLDNRGSLVARSHGSAPPEQARAIAGIGSGYITTWMAETDSAVWAARLDPDGVPVDSFAVFASSGDQREPAIAFDGDSTCLVVWTDIRSGGAGGNIHGLRVTTGGRVLDTTLIPIAEDPAWEALQPTVAYGQGVYLVAWMAFDTSYLGIVARAVRVSADGIVLDTAICLRHNPAASQESPSVAFGDTCFLATWSEWTSQSDVYAARISSSGRLIDSTGVRLSSSPDNDICSSVGFDGNRYLVMWSQRNEASNTSLLRGRRVTTDGVPLDSNLIRPDLPVPSIWSISVAADSSNFLVAFCTQGSLTSNDGGCMRISPAGAVLDSCISFPLGAVSQVDPSGASDGTDFLATWLEERPPGNAVRAARITADGTVLDPVGFTVNEASGDKAHLATGFGDSVYLVAWDDSRSGGGTDIYCARVSRGGQVLDPGGIAVCTESLNQNLPDIGFDGRNFLVVWQDRRAQSIDNIYAARVSPAGAVLDPNGFKVDGDSVSDQWPAVCFTGADYLVVWQGQVQNEWERRIYGALVGPGGDITRSRFPISRTGRPDAAAAAAGATGALVAWSNSDNIYAARVSPDGTVLDSAGLLVGAGERDEWLPHVTSDEDGFRVLWYYDRWDTTVFAAGRIDTSGNIIRAGDWFVKPGPEFGFDFVQGGGPELLALYSDWADTAYSRYYATFRLWARFGDAPGIEQPDGRQPVEAAIVDVRPNPASGAASLTFVLGQTGSVQVAAFDAAGRRCANLFSGPVKAGPQTLPLDTRRLANGVYFLRLEAGTTTHSARLVVSR